MTEIVAGDVLAIPAGMLVVTFSLAEEVVYLRWSVFVKADQDVVLNTVEDLLQSFPHLADTPYSEVQKMLVG